MSKDSSNQRVLVDLLFFAFAFVLGVLLMYNEITQSCDQDGHMDIPFHGTYTCEKTRGVE